MIPVNKITLSKRQFTENVKNSTDIPITFAFKAGTGGITDTHYLNNRQERGYKSIFFVNLPSTSISNAHLATKNLERIIQIMKPSISELASLFRVSRQTIYNWQSGEEPSIDNLKKIEELIKIANYLANEGLTSSQFLKRKIIGNQSLFDIIRTGGPSFEAAQKMVNILLNEVKQRIVLEERLKGRKSKPKKYDDYGSPMID